MIASSPKYSAGCLLALCLIVLGPGLFTLPPIDRDEPRFAQASAQMYESGDYVVPRMVDKPRLNKPPMVYWLQCASLWVTEKFGLAGHEPGLATREIWVYRLPGALCMIGTVLGTWWLGKRMFDERSALFAGTLLAVCPIVAWDAHTARADQLLLIATTLTQACLFVVWRRKTTGEAPGRWTSFWPAIGFWFFLAIGIMAKGPITPMVAGLTAACLAITTRRFSWIWGLMPVAGVVLVAAIVGPWIMAVGERVGWDVYWETIYRETIGRSTEAAEGHWWPPGYHLVLLVVLFFPGSLLTGLGLMHAWKAARGRKGDIEERATDSTEQNNRGWFVQNSWTFLLCWIVPAWVVFELISTKLPHYTMPMYPAIALLSARALTLAADGSLQGVKDRLTRWGFVIWGVLGCVLATLAIVPTARAVRRAHYLNAVAWAMMGLLVNLTIVMTQIAPAVLSLSPQAVAMLNRADPMHDRPIASAGYHEDSLVFLTSGRINRIDANQIESWLLAHPDGLLLADMQNPGVAERINAMGLHKIAQSTRDRLNISKLQLVELSLFEREAGHE